MSYTVALCAYDLGVVLTQSAGALPANAPVNFVEFRGYSHIHIVGTCNPGSGSEVPRTLGHLSSNIVESLWLMCMSTLKTGSC